MIMNEQLSNIRINQIGYSDTLPVHVAVLSGNLVILSENGNLQSSCQIETPDIDESSGDRVTIVNLGVLAEGEYSVQCGEEYARHITVKKNPWKDVTNALIKGLYYQRCGCELKPEHAGRFTHPACHTAPASEWENKSVKKLVTGGWHDAGDYGKYVGPGAVTVAHLLYTYILCPKGCSDELNIPESGNGVPDILNEARYELEWMLKMQREDGAFYHKLTKDHFAPFIMPQDDHDPEYLMPVSHCATAAACACLALSYRVYRRFDAEFADSMLNAALKASKWLDENPDFIPFVNPEGVRTGMYGDRSDKDERFWAAYELYAATGDEEYMKKAEALYSDELRITSYGWAEVSGLGTMCCLFEIGDKPENRLYSVIRERFIDECRKIQSLTESTGYGTALPPKGYGWGSILPIMSNAMSMIMYEMLTGDTSMREHALMQWNYALGLNALDICFVTGFGERSVMNPHHRPSGSDGIDDPVPGLISGGPNKGFPYSQTKEKLGENVPPAKAYLDELPSADTNEIAIYWNSPAIFVGAFFTSLC
jgi:endoglucanase